MIFTELKLKGAFLIEPQFIEDNRGFFARTVCEEEFSLHGLPNQWVQQNIAFNHKKGTLRGMHYQKSPFGEIKVVRCTNGAIYDVIVDLRSDSATYKKWVGIKLSATNRHMLYIPEGFAHGYLTLTDDAEISYLVSAFYQPEAEAGICYNDASIGIDWTSEIVLVSDKDRKLPCVK